MLFYVVFIHLDLLFILLFLHLSYCPPGPTHFDKEERGDIPDDDTGKLFVHRRSLSDSKLAALCSEVWPVLALIGGVDSGLRAGGLCLHRPSGRRAILLGVLKEGSTMAKLQWEEADLSVRYKIIYGRMSQLVSLKWQLSLTSINQFLYFPCLDPFSMFITVYNSFPVLFLFLLTFYFHFIISSSDLTLFFFLLFLPHS